MMTTTAPSKGPARLEDFTRYFDLSLALTRQQRSLVYQIRYQVYCEEFGYESTSALGNHQEVDEFDCQSMHCLVTHRESGIAAGCVRVVMVEDNDLMPMEKYARDSLTPGIMDQFTDQRDSVCEVSRLAVAGAFRRRRREKQTRFGDLEGWAFSQGEQRTFPLIAVALFLGAGAVADILNRRNCFAIMEPFLPALLSRTGLRFQRIGTDFEHRGIRAPYYANLNELNNKAPDELRKCFTAVRDEFAPLLLQATKVALLLPLPGKMSTGWRYSSSHQQKSCHACAERADHE